MVIECPLVITSIYETLFQTRQDQERGIKGAVNNHFPVYLAIFGMVATNNRPNNQVILVQVCSWPVRRQSFAMCGSFAELSNIFILPLYQSWAIISFSVVAKLFNLFSKTLTTTSNQNHDSWHFLRYQVSPLSKSSPPLPDQELGKWKKIPSSDPYFIKLWAAAYTTMMMMMMTTMMMMATMMMLTTMMMMTRWTTESSRASRTRSPPWTPPPTSASSHFSGLVKSTVGSRSQYHRKTSKNKFKAKVPPIIPWATEGSIVWAPLCSSRETGKMFPMMKIAISN